jgi:hypothetical protein
MFGPGGGPVVVNVATKADDIGLPTASVTPVVTVIVYD